MSISRKHRRGYFENNISQNIIKAAWSFYETDNKKIAKQIGISDRTLYNIKSGKNTSNKTKNLMKKFLIKSGSDAPKLATLIEHYKITGKIKKLNVKEVDKLISKKKDAISDLQKKLDRESQVKIYKNLFYSDLNTDEDEEE